MSSHAPLFARTRSTVFWKSTNAGEFFNGLLELLVLPIRLEWLLAGGVATAIVLLPRFVSVAGIIGALRIFTPQSRGAIRVLTWAGLRGGISVAMALSLPANDSRSLLLTLTYIVVIFSLLVQGLTVGRLIRRVSAATGATHTDKDGPGSQLHNR